MSYHIVLYHNLLFNFDVYYIAFNLCTTNAFMLYTFILLDLHMQITLPDFPAHCCNPSGSSKHPSEVGDVLGRSITGPVGRCIGPSRLWILVLLCHDVGRFCRLRRCFEGIGLKIFSSLT